jgi:hypothetical protein
VFSNISDLTSLRKIYLEHNALTSLEPWPLVRGLLGNRESVVAVRINGNAISKFSNKINFHFRCGMHMFLELDIGSNRMRHLTDLLKGFGLTMWELACLANQVQDGTYRHYSHWTITGNPFVCDCVDFDIYKLDAAYNGAHLLRDTYCDAPPRFVFKEILRIPLNEFECDITDGCPPSCVCTYRPFNATMQVDCSSLNLSSLPVELPALPKSYAKYKLIFVNNGLLQRLDDRPYYDNVAILDVSHSAVRLIVDADVWSRLTKIPFLSLGRNQLTSVPSSFVDISITSTELVLSNNPWSCSCEDRWMTN